MRKEGNVLIIGIIFIAIIIIIGIFVIAIFMSHINSTLYNLKLDMYSMNKSAVIAVNKNITNMDKFSFDKDTCQKEFIKLLKNNYDLDEELTNNKKLINSVKIKEYDIYEAREKDNFTNKRCDDRTIHTVLEVKITPIILRELLKDIFVFTIHEDVNLNMMIYN